MPASRTARGRINLRQPLTNHSLNNGLLAWWKVIPARFGGPFWWDLVNQYAALCTCSWTVQSELGGYGAGVFNGSSTSVNCYNYAPFQISTGTISAWFKTSTSLNYARIFTKDLAFGLMMYSGNLATYDWTADAVRNTGFGITGGKWNHATMTFNSGVSNGTILYLNGVARLTTQITVDAQTSSLSVGAGASGGSAPNAFLTGLIDDCRLHGRILSAQEVFSLYVQGTRGNPGVINHLGA